MYFCGLISYVHVYQIEFSKTKLRSFSLHKDEDKVCRVCGINLCNYCD